MNERSCIGCKYLYGQGDGYSNYTWMDTEIRCAKDANPQLPAEKPSDWAECTPDGVNHWGGGYGPDQEQWRMHNCVDNWPLTNQGRCPLYSKGAYIEFDVDGDNYASEFSTDWEQIDIVSRHADRPTSEAAKQMAAFLFIPGRK